MKAKVLSRYRDKNTKEIQEVGSIITVTKKRFEEINADMKRLEEIKEEKE